MPRLPQKSLFLVQPLYSAVLRNDDTFGLQNYRTVPGVLQDYEARRASVCGEGSAGLK